MDIELLEYLETYLTEARKQRFSEVLAKRTRFLTVAMQDVYQLHNTSAVLRSCDAFGVQDVHVVEDRFGHRLDKNIAMGAEQWVDVQRYSSTAACIESLKTKGYKIIATTPQHNACTLSDFTISERTALFFGTEKEGLSDEVLQKADEFLKIPMVGFSESLNISVSAAIIIQQLTQKLRLSTLQWPLTKMEILEKRLDWTKKSIKSVDDIVKRYRSENP